MAGPIATIALAGPQGHLQTDSAAIRLGLPCHMSARTGRPEGGVELGSDQV
jgi:hypothetical protein